MADKKIKKDDNLRRWLSPLLKETLDRGLDTSGEYLSAATPPDGRLFGPFDYVLFGQLLIKRVGWENTYPAEPDGERRPNEAA